jgi:CrcB protein
VTVLWVALGGAVGAPSRYVIERAVRHRTGGQFPFGTLLVNVTGSFVLGFLAGLARYHGFPATPKAALGAGFCGAYTTFSTFTFESVRLLEDGRWRAAASYVLVSVLAGGLAAAAGLALASL